MSRYETGRDFVMFSRAYLEDLELGELTLEEYGLLAYLFQKANPVTGDLTTNVSAIGENLNWTTKAKKAKIEYLLGNLKKKGYIGFLGHHAHVEFRNIYIREK